MNFLWMSSMFFLFSFSLVAQEWIPEDSHQSEVVQHFAISLGYSEEHEIPRWVGHVLRKEHLKDCFERKNNFKEDPKITTGSANPNDYYKSGYDRGHMAPAGDMKWSALAMSESFYMSNMSPQTPSLNRGRWKSLENLIRAWAYRSDETIINTGPILEDDLSRLSRGNVSIPKQFFKVVLKKRSGKWSAIGFLFDQNPASLKLEAFALPVKKIEELTGLDFFPHLSQAVQNKIESSIDWAAWNFKETFQYDACN